MAVTASTTDSEHNRLCSLPQSSGVQDLCRAVRMSVPVQDSLPDLADSRRPAHWREQTDLANGVRADVYPGWLPGSADVSRRLADIRARSN